MAETVSRMKSKVESLLLHFCRVGRNHDFVDPKTLGVGDSFLASGEQNYVRSEGFGKFHAHVPEAAEAHNSDFLSLADIPVPQRRVGRNAGAEQRRRASRSSLLRTRRTNASSTTMLSEYPP